MASTIIVKITRANIATVSPVRKRAAIGYATATVMIGRMARTRPRVVVRPLVTTSALYITSHTAAATIHTPERMNISMLPLSSPVSQLRALNGSAQNTSSDPPRKV